MTKKTGKKKDESPRVYIVGNFADLHNQPQVKRWNTVSRITRNSNNVDISTLATACDNMRDNQVENYVLTDLDRYLLSNGSVRLLTCSHNIKDQVTPHSHRYDFVCIVVEGWVVNRTWREVPESIGDLFEVSILTHDDDVGSHHIHPGGRRWYAYKDIGYRKGDMYGMTSDEIHSFRFSRDAKVLIFEGSIKTNESVIIEPATRVKKPTHKNRD